MSRLPLARFVGATVYVQPSILARDIHVYTYMYVCPHTQTADSRSILWGLICMALAAPQSFASFAAVRFILGAAEGVVSPAFVTMTSIWWRKGEHAPRIALWLGMTCTAQVVGCLLMYGIGRNGSLGLAPWRVLFLVCGALTAVCGVAFTVAMPQGPRDAWFLTARERQVLVARMAQDREGGDKTSFSGSQLREALRDPKVWIALVFGVLSTMPTGVLTFAAFVVKGIGYDRYDTMLYTAPSGAVQFGMLLVSMAACRLFPRNRTLVAVGFIIPPIVGTVLLMKLPLDRPWGIMVSAWLVS